MCLEEGRGKDAAALAAADPGQLTEVLDISPERDDEEREGRGRSCEDAKCRDAARDRA